MMTNTSPTLARRKHGDAGRTIAAPSVVTALLLLQQTSALLVHVASASPLPFALLHGFDNSCHGNDTMRNLEFMQESSGVTGIYVEIGGGVNSLIFMSMWDQVHYACSSLSTNSLFANGFNLVGLSQGGLTARAVVQTCDTLPPVHNLIIAGSPQAGQASIPYCMSAKMAAPCRLVNRGIKMRLAYRPWFQRSFAPAGYYKAPTRQWQYLKGCSFLPIINNEVHVNATYIARLTRINQLVLIMVSLGCVDAARGLMHCTVMKLRFERAGGSASIQD